MDTIATWHIHIGGQVQGVGFRPFVYQLAQAFGLPGWVSNTADGVHIEFNADEVQSNRFYDAVLENAPSLASITSHHLKRVEPVGYDNFAIVASQSNGSPSLLLPPDFALCERCRHEISDPGCRRYQYAFTTCTQCGPRYSIIDQLPYDRAHTTMADFAMCNRCQAEYHDPLNRRHYSQTNSCPDCPVVMTLWDSRLALVEQHQATILKRVCEYWHNGMIVAIKGIGGYLLTCDATNEWAIEELRRRKHRPTKPFALLFPDLASVAEVAHVTGVEAIELTSIAAPVVVLQLKEYTGSRLALNALAPRLSTVGAMLPYAPLYQLLLNQFGRPIVATSGNLSHAPIIYDDDVAMADLIMLADYILVHNREIAAAQDDSVVTFSRHAQQQIILRRARGLAPMYHHNLPELPTATLLAMGALTKSSFALVHQQTIHVSQYLGNTDYYDVQLNFSRMLHQFLNLFQAKPNVVLIDQHPNYFSSLLGEDLASNWHSQVIRVPHHEAHFTSVLGEHNLLNEPDPALGVVWDGAGLGDDGQIWGGEFFLFYQKKLQRVAHFTYFDHFLGDRMATEPRLSAFALGHNLPEAHALLQSKFSAIEWHTYQKRLVGNPLKTSSAGRLFDAVASLLGLLDKAGYEGEAAGLLEALADRYFKSGLTIPAVWLEPRPLEQLLSPVSILKSVAQKVLAGVEPTEIASWFHVQLVLAVRSVADQTQCRRLCFSGGVFQNSVLVDLLIHLLGADYHLCFNRNFSPNDENISFGQIIWYQNWLADFS